MILMKIKLFLQSMTHMNIGNTNRAEQKKRYKRDAGNAIIIDKAKLLQLFYQPALVLQGFPYNNGLGYLS